MQVIAIDGPAGAGKSTIARALAARLGVHYLDTGAMYRAVTLAALRRRVLLTDREAVGDVARTVLLELESSGDASDLTVLVDGVDSTMEIRTPEIDRSVSVVAANSLVREELRRRQREWAELHGGGVIEGRDIGSVVFPDARLKLYLTASARTRAERRVGEAGGDVDATEAAIAARDLYDSTRADSPLTERGAVVVDTTGLAVAEVLDRIDELLGEHEPSGPPGDRP